VYFVPEGQHDRSQALRDMVPERPSGSFVHSSEKGIEYEDEDEHDSGRIARLERLFFCSVRDLLASIDWSSSDDRAVFIPANLAPRQSSNRFRSGIVLVLVLVLGFLPPYE